MVESELVRHDMRFIDSSVSNSETPQARQKKIDWALRKSYRRDGVEKW